MDKWECIAENLQKARKKCGYSYQQLADKTGLSKSTLQRYESGAIQNLSLGKAEQLAQALNITPAELLGWHELNQYKELGDLDRLRELAQADREGRCVVLKFAPGSKVYRVWFNPSNGKLFVTEHIMKSKEMCLEAELWNDAYKTKEEAEKALEEMEETRNG